MRLLDSLLKYLKTEWSENPFLVIAVSSLLIVAFFLRVYRTDQLLGFYYDQGRDAQVIWDFWHKGKLFLIGPTTGIEGIFRGPWYYWLIAPFYLLGRGNPVWPSVFLSFTTVVACWLAYKLGNIIAGRWAGFIALIVSGLAFNLVYASRWLSNPTPMLLISMLLIYSLFSIMQGRKIYWIAVGFLLGISMQFGSAAEVFYFPAVLIFAVWQRKNLPPPNIAIASAGALLLTFLPQIVFDLKHGGILRAGINKFLFQKESFSLSFWEVVKLRIPFYFDVFFAKIFPTTLNYRYLLLYSGSVLLLLNIKKVVENKYLKVVILFLLATTIGMLFFQGNYGHVYDYYFTGYYLIFVLLVASLLGLASKKFWGKVFVLIFFFLFMKDSYTVAYWYLSAGVDGPNHITLGNQVQSVDWVIENAVGREFNQDVYVPPVIPYAYDYLFLWRTNSRCGENLCNMQLERLVPLLYTLYEVDPPHPERLDAWLARQKGIGKVEESVRFGGITVERRTRI